MGKTKHIGREELLKRKQSSIRSLISMRKWAKHCYVSVCRKAKAIITFVWGYADVSAMPLLLIPSVSFKTYEYTRTSLKDLIIRRHKFHFIANFWLIHFGREFIRCLGVIFDMSKVCFISFFFCYRFCLLGGAVNCGLVMEMVELFYHHIIYRLPSHQVLKNIKAERFLLFNIF